MSRLGHLTNLLRSADKKVTPFRESAQNFNLKPVYVLRRLAN